MDTFELLRQWSRGELKMRYMAECYMWFALFMTLWTVVAGPTPMTPGESKRCAFSHRLTGVIFGFFQLLVLSSLRSP